MSDDLDRLKFQFGPLSIKASGRFAIAAMITLCAMVAAGRAWGLW